MNEIDSVTQLLELAGSGPVPLGIPPAEIERFPFRPDEILDSIAELLPAEPEESEMPEVL